MVACNRGVLCCSRGVHEYSLWYSGNTESRGQLIGERDPIDRGY